MTLIDDIEARVEAARLRSEPFAIDKRRSFKGEHDIVDAKTGKVALTFRAMLSDPATADARDYIPYEAPPDWPGVVMVVHPAAWSSGGPAMVDALAKRFATEVHVFAHGSKWYLVFIGEPGDRRTAKERREDEDDERTGPNDGGLYVKGACQWWAVAYPDGTWKNLATS